MESLDERASAPLLPKPAPRTRRLALRWRGWPVVLLCGVFLLGVGMGVGGILLYAFSIAGQGRALITPKPPQGGAIVAQVSPGYITQLVEHSLTGPDTGLPGQVKNVAVSLKHGDQMVVSGDDTFPLFLGITASRHFTIIVQPYVTTCQLQMHILQADMNGIPVTGFVERFEGKINQQLQVKPTGLPTGFVYCTIAVRTEVPGLFVTYSATAI